MAAFDREEFLRTPGRWGPKDTRRIWKSGAPGPGLNYSPFALRRSLQKQSVNSIDSPSKVGLKFGVSSSGPRLCFVFRKTGGVVGAITQQTHGSLGYGEPDILKKARRFLDHRLGKLKVQGKPSENVGVEMDPMGDFPWTLTRGVL